MIMIRSRILIIDDDPNLSRLVATLLVKLGDHEVCIENRSYAARATAEEFHPDLMLLDVDMPGKDGGQVAAEFQADPRFANVPIIFLTSLISPNEAADDAVMRGGMPFLAKPVNPQALARTVRRLLAEASPTPA